MRALSTASWMTGPNPMLDLPRFALSIRQPWAWAILHAGKDIENRDWRTYFRGPVCIHAAKGMTKSEFSDFVEFSRALVRDLHWKEGAWVPFPDELQRGGIVGTAEIVACVDASPSPWFFGRHGFVLRNARPVDFIPVKGALGFFDWRANIEDNGK